MNPFIFTVKAMVSMLVAINTMILSRTYPSLPTLSILMKVALIDRFKTALTKSVKDYAERKELIKNKNDTISGDDVREGLTAVFH